MFDNEAVSVELFNNDSLLRNNSHEDLWSALLASIASAFRFSRSHLGVRSCHQKILIYMPTGVSAVGRAIIVDRQLPTWDLLLSVIQVSGFLGGQLVDGLVAERATSLDSLFPLSLGKISNQQSELLSGDIVATIVLIPTLVCTWCKRYFEYREAPNVNLALHSDKFYLMLGSNQGLNAHSSH